MKELWNRYRCETERNAHYRNLSGCFRSEPSQTLRVDKSHFELLKKALIIYMLFDPIAGAWTHKTNSSEPEEVSGWVNEWASECILLAFQSVLLTIYHNLIHWHKLNKTNPFPFAPAKRTTTTEVNKNEYSDNFIWRKWLVIGSVWGSEARILFCRPQNSDEATTWLWC